MKKKIKRVSTLAANVLIDQNAYILALADQKSINLDDYRKKVTTEVDEEEKEEENKIDGEKYDTIYQNQLSHPAIAAHYEAWLRNEFTYT